MASSYACHMVFELPHTLAAQAEHIRVVALLALMNNMVAVVMSVPEAGLHAGIVLVALHDRGHDRVDCVQS